MSKSVNKLKSVARSGIKGTSHATTVAPVGKNEREGMNSTEDTSCCEGGHTLDSCSQLAKRPLQEKIDFLREKGVCFGCLFFRYISKHCRKQTSFAKCGLKHLTVLHISSKEKGKGSDQAEKKSEVSVDRT